MSIKAKERILNVFIFIGVVGLLFVVGYPQYKESLPSRIKIGVDRSFSSIPFYVARDDTSRQYFAREKIEAEFVTINGDPLQGIKDGLYDIAAVPWYSLLISPSSDGDTIKAWSSIELKSGRTLDAIIVSSNSKIRGVRDLKNKNLGYMKGEDYLIDLILTKMERDRVSNVKKVPLEPEEIASALENKKVDAVYLLDPYRGYMIYLGNKVLFEGLISYYLVPSIPYMAIVMRKGFVKDEDRIAAIRVKDAVEATLNYLTRNPEVAKNMMVKLNRWPADGALTLKMRTPEYQRLAEINLKNVEYYQTELVRMGIGTCGIKPNEFLFEKTDFVR